MLISWADGRRETHEIPPNGTIRVGPRDEPAATAVDLYSPSGKVIGAVIVHGAEVPSLLVCPAPVCPAHVRGERLEVPEASDKHVPEWLAEFMHELDVRHNLRAPDGCEAAMHEAARMSDSFGFRCRSCASLARGYRSAGGALAAIRDEDQEGWARHNSEASRHFREAVDLARQGEEVGA